jgi:hypothetical protein
MTIGVITLLLIVTVSACAGVGIAAMACAAGRADEAGEVAAARARTFQRGKERGYREGWRAAMSAMRGKRDKGGAA